MKAIVVIFAAATLAQGVTIQCSFDNVVWDFVGSQYTCYPTTIISDGNLTRVINVTGNHLNGKTDADVGVFYINSNHQHLIHIPEGLEKFFPNLISFGWHSGNLATLTSDDLEPFPNLQVFSVLRNKLASLDGDLFKHTPKLWWISFGENLIENIGFGLLDGLNNLTTAYFYDNPCINFGANTPAAIQELKLTLRDQCPHLEITTTSTTTLSTTDEPEHCSITCVELIETFKDSQRVLDERQDKDISDLKMCMIPEGSCRSSGLLREELIEKSDGIAFQNQKITSQNEKRDDSHEYNGKLNKKIEDQDKKIAALSESIQELEKQIRDLWERP